MGKLDIQGNLPLALNATFGSILIVTLILINYTRRYCTDRFQRVIFCALLAFYIAAMASDLALKIFEGTGAPGGFVCFLLNMLCVTYYLFQTLSFCCAAVFMDYIVFREASHVKKLFLLAAGISVIHLAVLLLSCKYGFYFYIDPSGNYFRRGGLFFLRLAFGIFPALFAFGELAFCFSSYSKSHIAMFLILMIFFFSGSAADLVFINTYLLWPFGTAALLYSYFFIARSDTRIDPLTEISNRFSFNEFTEKISRRFTGESWAVVMIDMDKFKMINDTHGHLEGDNALCDMAGILKSCVRGDSFAARYGGDEFMLVLKVDKGADNGIARLMNEVQAGVDALNAKKKRPFKLEFSYGYDVYTQDGSRTVEEFMAHIDSLMYKHKEERRRSGDIRQRAGR
ncbi:MAG: GGDEF domain-containing protein [Treponema sp.]|nr:GGDEF domain-containing protein [Treponema sp.]